MFLSILSYRYRCFHPSVKNYVRYGGVSPKAGLDNGIKTYKNYGVETCSHKCLSHPGGTCKSFGIRSKGGNATHDVTFQVGSCSPVDIRSLTSL